MRRLLGLIAVLLLVIIPACSARNKRCDAPNGGCGSGHPWFNSQGGQSSSGGQAIFGNHPWFNKNQPAGTLPPGATVGPAVEGVPGGYQPPPLQGGTPGFGPTPDTVAPPVPPANMSPR